MITVSDRPKPIQFLVEPGKSRGSLILTDMSEGSHVIDLTPEQASAWNNWRGDLSWAACGFCVNSALDKMARLTHSTTAPEITIDGTTPEIEKVGIKWYSESNDLTVIFNTAQMARLNPLIVLNAYGSMIWRMVSQRATVRRIREAALATFGFDEVVDCLNRLASLRLIAWEGGSDNKVTAPIAEMEFSAPAVQSRLKQSMIPWYCLWELNTSCNLRCKICYQDNFTDRGPDIVDTLGIVRDIVDSGVFYVALLGGEPLVRRDLESIVENLRAEDVFVKIITNGTMLTRNRAEKLAHVGLNQLEVSLDGLCARTHDESRGVGNYAKAVRGIAIAQAAGVPRVGVTITAHSRNLAELSDLPGFLATHKLTECYISLFKHTGTLGSQAPWLPPTSVQIDELKSWVESWKSQWPDIVVTIPDKCSCGRTSVVIGPDGRLRNCTFGTTMISERAGATVREKWLALRDRSFADGPLGYCAC